MARSTVILLQIALCLTVLVVQTYSSNSWTSEVLHRTKRQQAECPVDDFRCTSRECIAKFYVCDGIKDCADGSDEAETACKQLNINPSSSPQNRGCLLPQPPENGTYIAAKCVHEDTTSASRQVPGIPVSEFCTLSFNCNEGYYIKESQNENYYSQCYSGTWSPKIPVCRKMCSPLESLGVTVKCFNGKDDVDCAKPMRPGTRAKGECKPFYSQYPQALPYTEIVCKENGQWSYELFSCKPVCGMRNTTSENNPLFVVNNVTKYGDLPWHAGLYKRNSSNQWALHCGGTLISPHIVLTAATCFYEGPSRPKIVADEFKVGLGKNYEEWTHYEPDAVKADVREILLPSRYRDWNLAQNIALVDLTHSVQLRASIMPACIDWDRELTITPGTLGMMPVWRRPVNGTLHRELRHFHFRYVDYRHCIVSVPKVYITSDIFCAAVFDNGLHTLPSDAGGGLTFVQDDVHYVYGIKSLRRNYEVSLTPFTNISDVNIQDWLRSRMLVLDEQQKMYLHPENPTSSPQKGACLLPQPPENGTYTAAVCVLENRTSACSQVPGTPVTEYWALSFNCNEGYYIKETQYENYYSWCVSGKWSPEIPGCRKMCSPLVSLSVAVRCFNAGGDIDCTKPMRPGTRATGECKPSYTQTRPLSYTELICRDNGQWSNPLFYCEPACGKRNKQGVNNPLLLHGSATKYGEFPWHVGLYLINKSNQWEQSCGGTLISPHIVLTAAHCVFSETLLATLPPEALKVGLGKKYREWSHDEPHAVQANVRKILIPPTYYGRVTSYAHDIALVDLTHSVQVHESIMPVCVDWKHHFTITPGKLGTLAGWGKTENGTPSDVLLYANLPYVDRHSCILGVPQPFRHYVTTDKFCAGYTNGTGAANGDSGGGITFVWDDLHYVHGIVSTKVKEVNSFTTLTNISNVELFIWLNCVKEILDSEHSET